MAPAKEEGEEGRSFTKEAGKGHDSVELAEEEN